MKFKTTKLLLASKNQGKLEELKVLLQEYPLEVISLEEYPELPETIEDGKTFEENAIKKAWEKAKQTGLLTIADDSGLEVEALGNKPGVYSARFAGEPKSDKRNNQKLLSLLKGIPLEERKARFVSVIAIATPEKKIYTVEGTCEGRILFEEKGAGGFGYDPLFYFPDLNKTFAELTLSEKNKVSHRGKALRKATQILGDLFNRA